MFKRIAKVAVPTGGVGGVVCLTMYLTNVSNTALNSLKTMDIEEKPRVPEDDLQPTKPPESPAPTPPQEQETPKKESEDISEASSAQKDSSQSDSSESEPSQEGEKDEQKVIRELIKEIQVKQPS